MAIARWYPSATQLPDGRVVTIGGNISPGVFAETPEVYDPISDDIDNLAALLRRVDVDLEPWDTRDDLTVLPLWGPDHLANYLTGLTLRGRFISY